MFKWLKPTCGDLVVLTVAALCLLSSFVNLVVTHRIQNQMRRGKAKAIQKEDPKLPPTVKARKLPTELPKVNTNIIELLP